MQRINTIGLLVAAVLGVSAAAANADATFEDGVYVANFGDGNCGRIEVKDGVPISYVYAAKCDPVSGVLYTAQKVGVRGSTVTVDAATLDVKKVDASVIEGMWSLNGNTFPMTFSSLE